MDEITKELENGEKTMATAEILLEEEIDAWLEALEQVEEDKYHGN